MSSRGPNRAPSAAGRHEQDRYAFLPCPQTDVLIFVVQEEVRVPPPSLSRRPAPRARPRPSPSTPGEFGVGRPEEVLPVAAVQPVTHLRNEQREAPPVGLLGPSKLSSCGATRAPCARARVASSLSEAKSTTTSGFTKPGNGPEDRCSPRLLAAERIRGSHRPRRSSRRDAVRRPHCRLTTRCRRRSTRCRSGSGRSPSTARECAHCCTSP